MSETTDPEAVASSRFTVEELADGGFCIRTEIGGLPFYAGRTYANRISAKIEKGRILDALDLGDLTLPGHKCERIANLSPRMTGPDRELWIGRLLEPIEGYPDEEWCLHVRTPEKPEIVFGHNVADWEFMAALSLTALGRHINPRWLERMAESAMREAGQEPPEFDRSALDSGTEREPVAWRVWERRWRGREWSEWGNPPWAGPHGIVLKEPEPVAPHMEGQREMRIQRLYALDPEEAAS